MVLIQRNDPIKCLAPFFAAFHRFRYEEMNVKQLYILLKYNREFKYLFHKKQENYVAPNLITWQLAMIIYLLHHKNKAGSL